MALSLFFAAVACYALMRPQGDSNAQGSEDDLQAVLDEIKDRQDQASYGEGLRLIHRLGRERPGSAAERALLEILTDAPNDGVRITAVRQLGRVGSEASVRSVSEMLKSSRQSLVTAALRTLGEIGTQGAVEALLEFLETGAQEQRQEAIHALGKAGGGEALAQLIELATDPFERFRREAIAEVGRIGGADAVGILSSMVDDSNRGVQLWAIGALGATGDPAARSRLMELVESAPMTLRQHAVDALSQFYDPETQTYLAELFHSADPDVASQALLSMDKDTLLRSEDEVVAMARLSNPQMDYTTVATLARMGTPKAEAALIQMLYENRMPFQAADALAQSGTAESRHALMEMATRGSVNSQQAAVAMLGQLKGEGVDQVLSEVIRSGSGAAAATAVRTLAARQGAEASPMLIELIESGPSFLQDEALQALSQTGDPRAKELVLQAARSGKSQVAGAAMNILAESRDPETKETLMELLKSGEMNVRNRAAEMLGRSFKGDESVRTALLASLKDPHQSHASSWALSQMHDPETHRLLEGVLQDQGTSTETKQTIAATLANNGNPQALQRMATNPDPKIAAVAIHGIGAKGNPEMVPILRDLVQAKDENIRSAAISSLAGIGNVEAIQTLESALQDPDRLSEAASALGQVRSQKATEILINQFSGVTDPGHKTALINAISMNASKRGEELLLGALQDSDSNVSLVAAQALMNIGGHQEQLLAYLNTSQDRNMIQQLGHQFKYRYPQVYAANKGLFEAPPVH